MITAKQLFDLSHTLAAPLLEKTDHPWQALDEISAFILALGPGLPTDLYEKRDENIWIAKDARIFPHTSQQTSTC